MCMQDKPPYSWGEVHSGYKSTILRLRITDRIPLIGPGRSYPTKMRYAIALLIFWIDA